MIELQVNLLACYFDFVIPLPLPDVNCLSTDNSFKYKMDIATADLAQSSEQARRVHTAYYINF